MDKNDLSWEESYDEAGNLNLSELPLVDINANTISMTVTINGTVYTIATTKTGLYTGGYVCDADGNRIDLSSGSAFYIKIMKNYFSQVTKITVTVKRTQGNADSTIYILTNSQYQNLILVDKSAEQYSRSIEYTGTIDPRGNLTITKVDAENTSTKLTGMKFKIEVLTSSGISYSPRRWLSGSDYSWTIANATTTTPREFDMEGISSITLKGLKTAYRYKIWETDTPEGYALSAQVGYDSSLGAADITPTSGYTYITLVDDGTKKVTVKDRKLYANIKIIKTDEDTDDPIEGMGFTIINNARKDAGESDYYVTNTGEYTPNETILYTAENGEINITKIDISDDPTANFTVTEAYSNNLYYQTDTNIKETKSVENYVYTTYADSVYTAANKNSYLTFELDNAKAYSLTLYKKDYDKQDEDLEAKFYIKYNIPSDEANSNPVGSENDGKWLTLKMENNQYVVDANGAYYGDYADSKSSITVSSDGITIKDIQRGTYTIYEYEAPKGYDIELQYNYQYYSDIDEKGVYCGTVTVGDDGSTDTVNNYNVSSDESTLYSSIEENEGESPTVTIYNRKWIAGLNGFVWVDNTEEEKNEHNYYYEDDEELLEDIYVELYTIHGLTTYDVLRSTTTDENGAYEFNFKKLNLQVLYWDLCDYYVCFTYDNETYIAVDPFVTGEDSSIDDYDAINSKAQEYEMEQAELDDANLVEGKNYNPGYAITNSESENLGDDGCLAKYYNESECTIDAINLGLLTKEDPEYSLSETLAYAYITINDFTYIYYFDKPTDTTSYNSYDDVPDVAKQQATSTDDLTNTLSVYSSDIASTIAGTSDMQLYLVYSIYVYNSEELADDDIYNEQKLYLSSLTNKYDFERMELSDDNKDNSQYTGSDQFDMWTTSYSTVNGEVIDKRADYKLLVRDTTTGNTVANKDGDNMYRYGINAGQTIKTYIQFKVNDTYLEELILGTASGEGDEATTVTTTGFHEYLRTDNLWHGWDDQDVTSAQEYASNTGKYPRSEDTEYKYETENDDGDLYYIHKSVEEKRSVSLYVTINLLTDDDERTISGTVYEDVATEVEGTTYTTYVGNGIIDSTESNRAKDVTVELLNASDFSTSTLYVQDTTSSTGYKAKLAKTWTRSDGSYSFVGVIPGYYYIKFTYGDGTQTIVDTNGDVIDYLTSVDYKSTIINSDEGGYVYNAMVASWSNHSDVISQATEESEIKEYYDTGTESESSMEQLEWYKYLYGLGSSTEFNTATDDLRIRDEYNDYTYTEKGIYDGEPEEGNLIVRYHYYDSDDDDVEDKIDYMYEVQYVDDGSGNMVEDTTDTSVVIGRFKYDSNGELEDIEYTGNSTAYPLTIQAYTPETAISIENTKLNYTDNGDEHVNVYDKFDLGVVKQPETDTTITKTIVDVDVALQIGTTVVSSLDSKYVSSLDSLGQNYGVEMEESEIYGSYFQVQYQIEVKNISQFDYIETDSTEYGTYYKYGQIASSAKPKTIKINEVVDDIDEKYIITDIAPKDSYTMTLQTVTTSSGTENEYPDSIKISEYYKDTTTTVGENSTTTENSITLTGWEELAKNESSVATYTVYTTLSSTDDTLFENCARITSLSLNNLTTLTSEYVWGRRSSTVISIFPATGGDMRNVLYIGGAIALLAIAFGLVLIKKKVI